MSDERAATRIGDPRPAAEWRCRNLECETLVEVNQAAVDSLATFNAQLERRRQPPISTDQVVFCDRCRAEHDRATAESRRAQDERIGPVVKLLSQSAQPEREHAMIRQLRQWGHPDVDGLVRSLVERRGPRGAL